MIPSNGCTANSFQLREKVSQSLSGVQPEIVLVLELCFFRSDTKTAPKLKNITLTIGDSCEFKRLYGPLKNFVRDLELGQNFVIFQFC